MMSEMQTRLKHLFDTAIMMTSNKTIACKIWTKNTARKSTGVNNRHGLDHCKGHEKRSTVDPFYSKKFKTTKNRKCLAPSFFFKLTMVTSAAVCRSVT